MTQHAALTAAAVPICRVDAARTERQARDVLMAAGVGSRIDVARRRG